MTTLPYPNKSELKFSALLKALKCEPDYQNLTREQVTNPVNAYTFDALWRASKYRVESEARDVVAFAERVVVAMRDERSAERRLGRMVDARGVEPSEKAKRLLARDAAAATAAAAVVATMQLNDDRTVELGPRALFSCAGGAQKWVIISTGEHWVAVKRSYLREVESAIKKRDALRCYWNEAKLCFRWTSASGKRNGGGLDLVGESLVNERRDSKVVSGDGLPSLDGSLVVVIPAADALVKTAEPEVVTPAPKVEPTQPAPAERCPGSWEHAEAKETKRAAPKPARKSAPKKAKASRSKTPRAAKGRKRWDYLQTFREVACLVEPAIRSAESDEANATLRVPTEVLARLLELVDGADAREMPDIMADVARLETA